MPVAHCKTQVVFHRFTGYNAIFVITSESQRIVRLMTFKFDFPYSGKKFLIT